MRSSKMLGALLQAGHRPQLFSLERPASNDWRDHLPRGLQVAFEDRPARAAGHWRSRLALIGLTPRHFRLTYSPATMGQLRGLVERQQPKAVVAFELKAGAYVARLEPSGPARLLDGCEPFQLWSPARANLRTAARHWKFFRFLRRLLERYDVFLAVSELEREWIQQRLRPRRVRGLVVENGTDLHPAYAGEVERARVVYTGSLTYSANREAVDFFVRQVWPGVKRMEPAARFVVTGALPDPSTVNGLGEAEGVTLAGLVDDYPTFVSSSGVLAVPLSSGGGTRIKILEALALGCPVVTSPKGVEGLDLVADRDLLVAKTAEEFADAVVAVIRDGGLRRRLVERGRVVAEGYDWARAQRAFVAAVQSSVHP
jgi:polysaccharide biosynthesis protein PslH